jgi:hypothetical protein
MSTSCGLRRWAAGGVVAPLLVAMAGCGSTIQGGTTATVPGDGTTVARPGGGTGSATGLVAGNTGTVPGGTSTTGGGSGPGSGVPVPESGTVGGGSTSGITGAPSIGNAPGVTDTEIKIGITYFVNGDQAAKTAGYNLSRGDEEKNWRAVIAEVNARGGVAGRKLVPAFYAWDAQSTQTTASQEAAECAAFTQDNRVFAVVTTGTPDFTACLTRAGVLHATTGSYVGHDRDFQQRFPTFFEQRPSQERYQAALVSTMVRQQYFTGWNTLQGAPGTAKAKLGVLVIDRSDYLRPVERVLLPALRRAGHPVDSTLVLRAPLYVGAQDAGPVAAATKNAVLRFQQEGVTHVIILDANGTTTALFAQNAQSQLYFPRLAGTSASGFQQLYDLKALNDRQINGTVGLGWTPVLDLPAGQGDRYLSKAAPECLSVIKRRTGQTFTSTTAAGVAMLACDAVFPLSTLLKDQQGPLTRAGAVHAIESFGQRLLAASVPYLRFSPTQHDGLETAFDMVWDNACSCIRYKDAGHRLP